MYALRQHAVRLLTLLGLVAASSTLCAQDADIVPPATVGVGVTQRIGVDLPLDVELRDTRGRLQPLGTWFAGERPVLLTFNYSDCPQLCSLQLNNLVSSLREVDYTIGRDYDVVTVSIDPHESPERAALTQERYRGDYLRVADALTNAGRAHTEERRAALESEEVRDFHWHFLTGEQDAITRVANAAGFAYNLDPQTGEYAHDAVVVVVTPQGRISRYLPGVFYEPKDLELALVSASEGQLGGVVAWLRQTCYRWDPNANSFVLVAERLMMFGAGAGALALAAFLAFLWRRELVGKPATAATAHGSSPSAPVAGGDARVAR